MDLTSQIIAYEDGDLSDEDTIKLFQSLVDSGMAWELQGMYGRQAAQMISDGSIVDTHHVLKGRQ